MAEAERFRRGTELGRYLVLGRIAAGGMGVVYAAYDPDLDRRIAIKVLRADASDPTTRRGDLVREARAMASLAHPNVVTVHDVGIVDDEVFLAMELVEGSGLDAWLRDAKHGWREVVEVFAAAGRGLAAAHMAGIVHRDFKPQNVLVGRDPRRPDAIGRVCVTDFGLARASERDEAPADGDASTTAGTPAYMPPEQHRGGVVDARSDQFSFCVSLYEALYGQRPFAGETSTELADAAAHHRVLPPPPTDVPPWLHRLVLRGLEPEPDRRHASMNALLAELHRDRTGVRRWALLLGGLACLGALAIWTADRGGDVCSGAEEKLATAWDRARKDEVRAAFAATEAPFATDAWNTVERSLDAFGAAWVDARTEACEATRVRGEQSEALMDRRILCLDRERQELAALVDLFAQGGVETVRHAVDAALDLPQPAACADPESLAATIAPPAAELVAEVDAVHEVLARAEALRRAARFDDALALATEARDRADATDYDPLRAQALLLVGRLQVSLDRADEAKRSLHAGIVAARASNDARTEADLWIRRITLVEDYESVAELADASITAIGDPALLRARLLNALGSAREQAHRAEDALPVLEAAVAMWAGAVGADHPTLATPLINLGNVALDLRRFDDAERHFERALELMLSAVGPRHPNVAAALNNLCLVAVTRGRHDVARAKCEQSLAITEEIFGADHRDVTKLHMNLGLIAYELGDHEAALGHYEPAIAAMERSLPAGDPEIGRSYGSLAKVKCALGQYDAAMALHQRSLAMQEPHLSPGHLYVLGALHHSGLCELARGDEAAAIAYFDRVLERADEASVGGELFVALSRLARAKLLVDEDAARAVTLAEQARAYFVAHGDDDQRREAEAWLAEYRRSQ